MGPAHVAIGPSGCLTLFWGGGGVGISDPAFSPQMLGQLYTVIGLKQLANISNY